MLKDSFERIHTYLRISVTDRCNLRCRYCMPPEGVALIRQPELLRPEEIGQIAQMFAEMGIHKIRITGGEPLVRKGLDAILNHLAAVRSRPHLAITTNGLLLANWLDRLAAAGIRHLNISLDTLKPGRFIKITGCDGWQRVWDGIQEALRHPEIEQVKINVVLQRGINDDEIEDFAALTLRYPLDVRFIELLPVDAATWKSNEWISGDVVLSRLPDIEEVAENGGIVGPARMYRLPRAPGRIGLISGESCPACSGCNRLRLTARGMLLRCLFDPAGLDLREALRSGQPEETIRQQIQAFLMEKAEVGGAEIFARQPRLFSLCLTQVGG